jgi:hypothetical protein
MQAWVYLFVLRPSAPCAYIKGVQHLRRLAIPVLATTVLVVAGCGGSDGPPPPGALHLPPTPRNFKVLSAWHEVTGAFPKIRHTQGPAAVWEAKACLAGRQYWIWATDNSASYSVPTIEAPVYSGTGPSAYQLTC